MEKLRYAGKEVEAIFRRYWDDCTTTGRRATLEGFAGALDVSSSTLKAWSSGEYSKCKGDKWDTLSDSIKKCMDIITDDLQQGKDSMSIFRLKQVHYGGYIDKVQQEQSGALTINIQGGKGSKWGK